MSNIIEESFEDDRAINLFETALTLTELLYVITMVTQSSIKEWNQLELGAGGIQDFGLKLLHKSLVESSVIIHALGLYNNGLTSSSDGLVSDIAIACQVKQMNLNYNSSTLGESKNFTVLSHPSTCLQDLRLSYNTYTTDAVAMQIFSSLRKNKSLITFVFYKNTMQATENLCNVICKVLHCNTTLKELYMTSTKIVTLETLPHIMKALKKNNTLELLMLDENLTDGVSVIASQLDIVMKNRIQYLRYNELMPSPVLCIKIGKDIKIVGYFDFEESEDELDIDYEVQTGKI